MRFSDTHCAANTQPTPLISYPSIQAPKATSTSHQCGDKDAIPQQLPNHKHFQLCLMKRMIMPGGETISSKKILSILVDKDFAPVLPLHSSFRSTATNIFRQTQCQKIQGVWQLLAPLSHLVPLPNFCPHDCTFLSNHLCIVFQIDCQWVHLTRVERVLV